MTGTKRLLLAGRTLHAPKSGGTEAEYEDAVAARVKRGAPRRFAVAVADGASSAVFAREWAKTLVDDFAERPYDDKDVWERIAALGREWRDGVTTNDLPWYALEKIHSGSSATLLIVVWDFDTARWEARAVGDTCLFQLRGDRLERAFPVESAAAFDNTPALIPSEVALHARAKGLPEWKATEGQYRVGDRFLLMTDAVSAWFLSCVERGEKPWNDLPPDNEALVPWLDKLRATGAMRDDDVTIVILTAVEEAAK